MRRLIKRKEVRLKKDDALILLAAIAIIMFAVFVPTEKSDTIMSLGRGEEGSSKKVTTKVTKEILKEPEEQITRNPIEGIDQQTDNVYGAGIVFLNDADTSFTSVDDYHYIRLFNQYRQKIGKKPLPIPKEGEVMEIEGMKLAPTHENFMKYIFELHEREFDLFLENEIFNKK